ncbi:heavy-metal-associated domain-containing protein [Brumimicrobium oceani]|uniref:Heavy metal-associated protein n=1 Tax=Brumimicrobium oceani TaxID=2100725 RepID=A0A2U2XBB5_9FLAO|nr:heavy-metal-associated domain-containing protein [Brumimicrobium oceani]PWH85057.1 heavy metal-associated protein [Brumimicrobium oceani]
MEELRFKTTLKCGGCEEKVTPGLNAINEVEEWDVDLDSDDKVLSVTATKDVSAQIIEAVEKVGFEITKID